MEMKVKRDTFNCNRGKSLIFNGGFYPPFSFGAVGVKMISGYPSVIKSQAGCA